MLIRTLNQKTNERKGVILLVVISLLTLFAIVALSFLLYANAEANASKLFREAEANDIGAAGIDPDRLLGFFLKQLIFGVPDDNTGVYSAMRGYDFGRSEYGLNYGGTPSSMVLGTPNGPVNNVPFNGTGRLHTGPGSFMNPFNIDDYLLVNYTYFQTDNFLRDPERLGMRPGLTNPATGMPFPPGPYTGGFNAPYTYPDLNNMFLAAMKADGTLLMPSFHRHWLFNPNNLLNDATNPMWGDTRYGPPNPLGKYLTLRPRPVDQLLQGESFPPNRSYFDYPEDPGGDVRNLPPGLPGYVYKDPTSGQMVSANNDSIWMDLGAPVMTQKNGTKYKPLFAPLIIDLDNRININMSGNIRGWNAVTTNPMNQPHVSNQGWGPWEINLGQVLNVDYNQVSPFNVPEWANLFYGNGTTNGRYGTQGFPGSTNLPAADAGNTPHFYSQVDYDADDENNGFGPSRPISIPGAPTYTGNPYSSFPSYNTPAGAGGYGNGFLPPAFAPPAPPPFPPYERAFHPLLYNYFQPDLAGSTNQVFGISNMEALLRYGDTNSAGMTSDLLRLCPNNLQGTAAQTPMVPNPTAFIRNLVTTTSFDLDAPGLSPWAVPPGSPPPGSPGTYALSGSPTSVPTPVFFPQGPAAAFPSLALRAPGQPSNGDFNGLDWRSISAALGKINLNRTLTPYTGPSANPAQADLDRQQFAADIFIRLIAATGVYDLFNNGPTAPAPISGAAQFDALRWLAQLSANIVDFVDTDDVMTVFPWALNTLPSGAPNPAYQSYRNSSQYPYPQIMAAIQMFQNAAVPPGGTLDPIGQGWVVGTELPRVVINEAYAEFKTTPPETTPGTPPGPPTAPSYTIKVDVWAELHNPFNSDAGADLNSGNAVLFDGATSIYQVVLANTTPTSLRANNNVYGKVPPFGDPLATPTNVIYSAMNTGGIGGGGSPCVTGFGGIAPPGTPLFLPAGMGQAPTPSIGSPPQTGFFLVGPPTTGTPSPWTSTGFNQVPGQSSTNSTMEYTLPSQTGGTPFNVTAPTILLQRLMNPYVPPNIPGSMTYNPTIAPNFYVTVDYMQGGTYVTPGPSPAGPWTVYDSTLMPVTSRHSFGRVQPYTGAPVPSQLVAQAPAAPYTAPSGQPVNTFYSVNMPVPPAAATPSPFNWLTHLDRQLISPMELLNVSAFKPHELTQQFNTQAYAAQTPIPAPTPPPPPGMTVTPCFYGHRAPWFDEDMPPGSGNSHLLWRLFEFLETGNRAAGMTPGGRIPGKININTVFDQETFQAICSALQPGTPSPNYFDTGNVATIFNQILSKRSPGLGMPPAPPGDGLLHPPANSGIPAPPGQADQPILSLAAGLSTGDPQYPAGLTINNTLLQGPGAPGTPPFLQVLSYNNGMNPVTHPYLQDQLLSKIFNNLTTRSNVFAVFLTVGFFEVHDKDPNTGQTLRPVKLGAEIGKLENRQQRHKMFAIIDRTSLATEFSNPSAISPPPVFVNGSTYTQNPSPPYPANSWNISVPSGQFSPLSPGGPASLSGTYDGIPWFIQGQQPPPPGPQPILGTNVLIDTGVNQELVSVTAVIAPTAANLPPTITISNPQKAHAAPFAITPVNTVTSYTALAGPPPYALQASQMSGLFEAQNWSFQVGTKFLIDADRRDPTTGNPLQEVGIILTNDATNGITFQCATTPTGQFVNPHAVPYTISYPIPVLGNPGPQSTFNYRQVPWVVRYFSIVN